jgi:processive 1,2-diacylglycerol beta-glucosyltransferase
MFTRGRLLILTSSTGGGHDTRARTFQKWLTLKSKTSVLIDSILEKSSGMYNLGVQTYNIIQKRAPFMHKAY